MTRRRAATAVETVGAALAWTQVVTLAAVAALLIAALGGILPAPRALAGVAMALLILITWTWRLLRGFPADAWYRSWLWVWLALTLVVVLQLLPLPLGLFAWIGAYPLDLLERYPELPATRLSPNVAATIGYWGMFTTYWAAACLVADLPRRPLSVLVAVLTALVFVECLYGIVAHVNRYETILGLWRAPGNHGVVVGTYWNRNHLAGLIAVAWPVGIAYLLFGVGRLPRPIHEARFFLVVAFCIVLALALFNTQSRLGTASALFGLLVFTVLARANRAAQVSRLELLWLSLAGIIAFAMAIAFGLAPLLLRYTQTLSDTGRLEVLAPLVELPAKTWLLGAGAGAFQDVFKLVQPASLGASYTYLHNDWIQLLLELGLLGVAAVLLAVVPWWRCVRPPRFDRLRAGAAGGVAAIALHSLGDFNLQIPGTAVVFWITIGILCNRSVQTDTRGMSARPDCATSMGRTAGWASPATSTPSGGRPHNGHRSRVVGRRGEGHR